MADDEFVIAKSTYDFLFPMIDCDKTEEWKECFENYLGHYMKNTRANLLEKYDSCNNSTSNLATATCEILLDLGYRDTKTRQAKATKDFQWEQQSTSSLAKQDPPKKISNSATLLKSDSQSLYEQGCKDLGLNKILCLRGQHIYESVINLYNVLQTQKRCCIVDSQLSMNIPIWMILKFAVNTLRRPCGRNDYETLLEQEKANDSPTSPSMPIICSSVIHCGAYTVPEVVGEHNEDTVGWNSGVLLEILKEFAQDSRINSGEYWLILTGPFASPMVLDFILSLCSSKESFKDEGFHEINLNFDLKIIIEIEEGDPIENYISNRVSVLHPHYDDVEDSRSRIERMATNYLQDKGTDDAQILISGKEEEVQECLEHTYRSVRSQRIAIENAFHKVRIKQHSENETQNKADQLLKKIKFILKFDADCQAGIFPEKYKLMNKKEVGDNTTKEFDNVVTCEMSGCINAIRTIIHNYSGSIILQSYEGEDLTTFMATLQDEVKDDLEFYEFRNPLHNSCEAFVDFLVENLYRWQPGAASKNDDESSTKFDKERLFDTSTKDIVLAPPQDKEGFLIVYGIQPWTEEGSSPHLVQILRSLLKSQVVIHPITRERYRILRLRLLFSIGNHFHPESRDKSGVIDHFLPGEAFKFCWILSLPKVDRDSRRLLVHNELEKLDSETQEERQVINPLVELVTRFHDIISLEESIEDFDKQECVFINRIKSSLFGKGRVRAQIFDNSCRTNKKTQSLLKQMKIGSENKSISVSETNYLDRPIQVTLFNLVRFVKVLTQHKKLLSYSVSEIAFITYTEAFQAYTSVTVQKAVLKEILEYLCEKYLERVKDMDMFLIPKWIDGCIETCLERNYDEVVRLFSVPDTQFRHMLMSKGIVSNIQSILLLLKDDLRRGTHLIVAGEIGIGKTSLLQLCLTYLSYDFYILNESTDVTSQLQMLRDAIKKAGIEREKIAVISHLQNLADNTFVHIFSLIKYGWSESLWPNNLVRGILLSVADPALKPQNLINNVDETILQESKRKLLNNIRQNLSICFCGTPNEASQMLISYPSLFRECALVTVENWTTETLREVAQQILKASDIPTNVLSKTLAFLPQVHQSFKRGFKPRRKQRSFGMTSELYAVAEEEEDEEERQNETTAEEFQRVTVQDYLECCNVFVELLKIRKTDLKDKLDIYKDGLSRLETTTENIEELRAELAQLEPDLKLTQDEAQQLTTNISQQRNVVAELRSQMTAHEEKLKESSDVVSSMNEEISNEIKESLPDLESAERQIKILDKKDLVEVRVLNKPPDLVLQVMSAICLLLNVKPEWPAIKTLLGDPTMAKRLLEVEKDSLNDVILRKLRKFTEYPKFTPEEVGKLSKPCRPLCAWVRALDVYCQTLRNVEPKRGRVMEAERILNNLIVEQRQLQQKLGQAERTLSEQGARYEACVCRRQQLEGAVKRASGRLQRCTRLATVMADEHTRWQKFVKTLEDQLSCIYGECLLAAITVGYLGHMTPSERDKTLQSSVQLMQTFNIKVHRNSFNLLENLSGVEERKRWISAGLDNDPTPLIQASILMASKRPSLVFDIHQCLMPWLTRLFEGSSELAVVHLGQPNFSDLLLQSVKKNKLTVVTHTPIKGFDPHIKKVLSTLTKEKIGGSVCTGNRLIFVSGSSSEIPSDLRVYVTPLSFAMAPKVLEERLLNEVFKRERMDLFDHRTTLTALVRKDEEALHGVEMSILKRLLETTLGLLDNEELLSAFYEAKTTSAEYRTRLAESKRSLQKIGNARDKYRPVAARGRVLFSSVNAVQTLADEYVFSLKYLLKLFNECINVGGDEEITMSFDQRIETLVLTLTQKICNHVKRSIDSSHRLVFLASLTASVSYEEGDLSLTTWKALMKRDVTHKERFLKEVGTTEEEIKSVQDHLCRGVPVHLSLYNINTDLNDTYKKGGVPSFVPKKISDFNVLLLLRFYKPRMLLFGMQEVVKNVLRDSTITETKSTLDEMLNPMDRTTGVLLWTDYSCDILGKVLEWARQKQVEGMVRTYVSSWKGTCNQKVGVSDIASAIQTAIRLGGSVVIQDCASLSWSPEVLDQVSQITTTDTKIHEEFSLIFSTLKTEPINKDLILLTRPLQTIPSSDIGGILAEAAKEMDEELYEHHYQGAAWRKIVWFAIAVHAVVYLSQVWNTGSKFCVWYDENEATTPDCNFRNWVQLKTIRIAFDILHKCSLIGCLTEEYAIDILECLYGRKDAWLKLTSAQKERRKSEVFRTIMREIRPKSITSSLQPKIPESPTHEETTIGTRASFDRWSNKKNRFISLPECVGTVSKAAAHRVMLGFLVSQFPELHANITDKEFEAFKNDFSKISNEILKI